MIHYTYDLTTEPLAVTIDETPMGLVFYFGCHGQQPMWTLTVNEIDAMRELRDVCDRLIADHEGGATP